MSQVFYATKCHYIFFIWTSDLKLKIDILTFDVFIHVILWFYFYIWITGWK
jgi:hypothetical protein